MADSGSRVEMISGLPVVAAPAALDPVAADEMRRVLLDSVVDGHTTVVVDMTGTGSCDSAGLSMLVGAHRRALAGGGGLRLVASADGAVARALDLSGVGRFIPTFGSLEEALAAGSTAVIVPMHPRTSPEPRSDTYRPGRSAEGA